MKLVSMFVCRSYKDYKGKAEKKLLNAQFSDEHEQKSKLELLLSKQQGELKLGKLGKLFFYQN